MFTEENKHADSTNSPFPLETSATAGNSLKSSTQNAKCKMQAELIFMTVVLLDDLIILTSFKIIYLR